MNKDVIRIGILGPGAICPRFIRGARMIKGVEIYAVGSRSKERAKAFALEHQIPYHGTNEDLIADEHVDAIYLATPNHAHTEWIRACLEHGKHVLCEKPLVVTREECEALFELAYQKKLILMEAMKALFLPLTDKIKRIIESGEIGDVIYMDGKYSYHSEHGAGHWAYDPISGGGMRDVGVYPIGYFNYLANSPIDEVTTLCRYQPSGYDSLSQTVIRYQNGILASCTGGLELDTENKARIYGTKGYIEVFNFWKAGEARLVKGDHFATIKAEMDSDFKYETEHFVTCIRKGWKESPVMSKEASLQVIRTYESKPPYQVTETK